ncbi:hypothetical protein OG786_28725 [Streptomyces sp. NBC_00101]|uniref:hypothetical protein n=1 Tax=Streptomyces sp. NBC_00101 TaxID=2975651 RepID=UPI0032497232
MAEEGDASASVRDLFLPHVAVEGRMGRELPGGEGTRSEVTIAMEERIVGYLQGVWERKGGGSRAVDAGFPLRLPDNPAKPTPPLSSGLPTREY